MSKIKTIRSLIDDYLVNKALFNCVNEELLEADKRMKNNDYFVGKTVKDYVFPKNYEKRKRKIIIELVSKDLDIIDSCRNEQKKINELMNDDYRRINELVGSLSNEEFNELCKMLENIIKSFDKVITDNPYSDGNKFIPTIGLTDYEKYLKVKKMEYEEIYSYIKNIYNELENGMVRVR